MVRTDDMGVRPELLELEIARYKNLVDVQIPWADGMVIFGANGAGKTNLLECLAWLIGDAQTMALAVPRLDSFEPGSLSLVARVGTAQLPVAPDLVDDPWGKLLPRADADEAWWANVAPRRGEDLRAGLASVGVPDDVLEVLAAAFETPVIRYRLLTASHTSRGYGPSDEYGDWPGRTTRRFGRTLLLPEAPDWWPEAVVTLPEPFRAEPESSKKTRWVPVLTLPEVDAVPLTMQWFARSRTSEEANVALLQAFDTAFPRLQSFAELLAGLPWAKSEPPYSDAWLHTIGERRGREELRLTCPHISVYATVEREAAFAFSAAGFETHTQDDQTLDHFSSGERRWVDEALASMAYEMERAGVTAQWRTRAFGDLDPEALMNTVMTISGAVDQDLTGYQYWTPETLDLVAQALDSLLHRAAIEVTDGWEPARALAWRSLAAGPVPLDPQLRIRAIDEPEAHLHPAAQRKLAKGLEGLRRAGESVVVTSHSAVFLDLPGWQLACARRGKAGTGIVALSRSAIAAGSSAAREMGFTNGELLAGVAYVLLVEGLHDQLVLEELFGPELRAAGVACLRMHGTQYLEATAEMDFIEQYLHVPVGVLLDKPDGRWASERLDAFRAALRESGRSFDEFTLSRPDIVCYLNPESVQHVCGPFPGWPSVVARAKHRRAGAFKEWLLAEFGVDLRYEKQISKVLKRMADDRAAVEPELREHVRKIIQAATSSASEILSASVP